jgi:hypothetical protein
LSSYNAQNGEDVVVDDEDVDNKEIRRVSD